MRYLDSTFSVGGAGSKEYAENYDRVFAKGESDKNCTACGGRGQVAEVECAACSGTGLRVWQTAGPAVDVGSASR